MTGAQAPSVDVTPRIAMRGVTKRYGPIVANDRIDLEVARGGIHAIVGENGAGKTTLMRILYGLQQPDEGHIELSGRSVRIADPAAAIRFGIGMVHQRFELVEPLTALENLVLGRVPRRRGIEFDREAALAAARTIAERLGASIDWDRPVATLTVGARQRLEIMRLLYTNADVLIFDEPTSVLAPQEADELFAVLRKLAVEGRTMIFISHKLREVMALADRVTVLRRGSVVWSGAIADTTPQELATRIVGEAFHATPTPRSSSVGISVLAVAGLTVPDERGGLGLIDASMSVHTCEVVGIAGIEGSGQRELVEALVGLRRPVSGHITLGGEPIDRLSVRARRAHGLAFVSEDRDAEGACLPATLAENVIANDHAGPSFARRGWFLTGAIAAFAARVVERFGVQGGAPWSPARSLSGGNLQRLIVGRELNEVPRVLVAAHPTRGVDVRGIDFIHRQIVAARDAGAAVLLVSEDLGELIALSDRLVVLFEGRVVATIPATEATPEKLGAMMTGLTTSAA
jgi:general nucleoside transport system ATP-binding protein